MSVRPLRIFYPSAAELLTDYRPHGEGLIAWNLLSRLAARGHHVVACVGALDVSGPVPFEVVEVGRRQRFESLEPFARLRVVEDVFRQRGGARAFDAAHWLFPPNRDEIAFASAGELPFFYGPHSPAWPEGSGRQRRLGDVVRVLVRPLLRRRYRSTLRAATAVFVSVPEAARELPRDVASRVQVIPFGVDAERFTPTSLPPAASALYVGSLARRKGVRTLLQALARLDPCPRLVIAGTGPELEPLRRLAGELGLDHCVDWLGSVPHENVPELLHQTWLLCVPSIGEPFGMVILEAMASGRAVVAGDGPGPRFLVDAGRGGLLVGGGDVDALARALRELLADPARIEAMGRHNRAKVERDLSWQRVVGRLETAYTAAAEARPR